jgi:nucleoside-diphosphate-sugar epimerase
VKRISLAVVGCGDLGVRAGTLLQAEGWQVAGVRRSAGRLPAGFGEFTADYAVSGSLGFLAATRPDLILATFNPLDRGEEGYRRGFVTAMENLLAGLGGHRPQGICMVSSTRVFAERQGGWVDESSALACDDAPAAAIIEAENTLRASSHPACVVRFGGIYGGADGHLLSRIRRGELCSETPLRYSNRIHRDDCAGFLAHLLRHMASGERVEPVYIGVDDDPAPQYAVESWLARRCGVTARPGAAVTRAARGHKRCRNRLLHASGYRLIYPDYRSGYRAVLAGAR